MHYTDDEIRQLGVSSGRNVRIHRSVVLLNPQNIVLGDHVRIDCFSIVSAGPDGIRIGRNVHLAAGVYIFGGGGRVTLEDFAGFSSRVSLYTASDDYTDGFLTNPTVPLKYRKLATGAVYIRKHVIVGSGSVIMPGVDIGQGASIGALTLIRKSVGEFQVISGNPPRRIATRDRRILDLEQQLLLEDPAIRDA
jgi:dTDP-4-amino-4,6-dideoxy-D-glucose acyltransferase